jgi:hypothetical protein
VRYDNTIAKRWPGPWVGYAAAGWAFVFTFLHVAWALGWYIALSDEVARIAFDQTWKLIYDIVIAGMCALAVVVALALVQPWGRRVSQRWLNILAVSGTALLVLRGGGGLIQTVYLIARGRYSPEPMHLYEVWFCLGAFLFAATLWRSARWPDGRAHQCGRG